MRKPDSLSFPVKWALKLIGCYQKFVSPCLGRCCRFHPTCSSYAKKVLNTHPFHAAWRLILIRLLKCNPWYAGGIDEPPKRKS